MLSLKDFCKEQVVKAEEGESLFTATFDRERRLIIAEVNIHGSDGECSNRVKREIPLPCEGGHVRGTPVTVVAIDTYSYFLVEGDEAAAMRVAVRQLESAFQALEEAEALLRVLAGGKFRSDKTIVAL